MKRALPLLLTLIVMVACATPAVAGGVAMSWGDYCSLSTGGYSNLTWACRSDTFAKIRMTCSFVPEQSHADFIGARVLLVGMAEVSAVPNWWQLGTGGCREGSLTLSTDGSNMAGGQAACIDPWAGQASSHLEDWWVGDSHLYVTAACSLAQPVRIEAGLKYFACQFRLDARKTTTGECRGCPTPVILGVRSIELQFAGGGDPELLEEPVPGDGRCVGFQGPVSLSDERNDCFWYEILPARGSTWGQIKSLYR